MTSSTIQALVPLGLLCIAIIGYKTNKNKTKNLLKETLLNIGIYLGFQLSINVARVFNEKIFLAMSNFTLLQFSKSISTFLITFLIVDFTYYWTHRINHKNGLFWSMHSVHHSSNEFNFSTALRLPWFAPFINWVFYIPLVLAGFPLKFIAISHVLNLWFQFFVHTQLIGKLGIIDHIFNTPSNHRVHHSREAKYLDKNFGGVFMIWDKLFGTYQAEVERVQNYGITGDPINSHNPFVVNLRPIVQYIKRR